MKKYKFYFEVGDWEQCLPLDYFEERLKESDAKELHIVGAVIDYGGDGMYCSESGETMYKGEGECGLSCSLYKPRNGKSGRCCYSKNCYRDSGEAFVLTESGVLFLSGSEPHEQSC